MYTILRDISIAWTLLHCCIMFMLLYESRYSAKTTNIVTTIVVIPLILINIINVALMGRENAGRLMIFTCILPSLLFFFIMSKSRDTRFLFTFCLVDTVTIEIMLITSILDTFLGFENYIVMFITRLIIFPAVEYLIVKYLRKPYHLIQQKMKSGWGVFSILSALFYITIFIMVLYPTLIFNRPAYYPSLVMILILVPVMYITIFMVFLKQFEIFNISEENRTLNMQIKVADKILSNGKETENYLKIIRHDIRHQLILLNDYINNKQFDEAVEYMNNITEHLEKNTVFKYCNNNSVNVIISHFHNIANQENIDFNTEINLPNEISISDTDIAVILSNALENSINALKNCDNKKIYIKIFVESKKIFFEIKNPFNEVINFINGIPQSNKENHGYGTKSIAKIVKKYDGIFSFTTENGYFIFRCAI